MSKVLFKAKALLNKGVASAKDAKTTFDSFPTHNKIGLGVSVTGLGLGVTNFVLNKNKVNADMAKAEIDKKSLNALNKIHKALVELKAANPDVKVD